MKLSPDHILNPSYMRYLIGFFLLLITTDAAAQNLRVRSVTDYTSDLSDIWGYAADGREYALLGTMDEFTVIDVTDADNPVRLDHTTVPGPNTYWRDIKTYGHYAYGVHDSPFSGQSQGLVIMNLAYLPDSMPTTFWATDGSSGQLRRAHNIFIDEEGYAYVVGSNLGGGTLILDLNQDPEHPVVMANYNPNYVHDCFVRNDTLWTSDGGQKFSIIDVSDRTSPQLLARGDRPGGYSHNIWVSDDGRTAFTTDESGGGKVLSHDVSDLNDIEVIDEYKTSGNVIPHNVMVENDYLVIAYYRDGVLLVDASVPDQMVEVGHYDTSPNYSGGGFNGCWGVYPYLPSGNILASDIEEGMYVLTPNYQRAVRFRGTVVKAADGLPIFNANVLINGSGNNSSISTGIDGTFRMGYPESGTYTVTVSHPGYETEVLTFAMENGKTETFTVTLHQSYTAVDTLFGEVDAGGTVTICEDGVPGFQPSQVFSCDGSESSDFGTWTYDVNGCMEYDAGLTDGEFVDTICLVFSNSGDEHVSLVIISINAVVTGAADNAFDQGLWSLAQNPVRDILTLQYSGNSPPLSAAIFSAEGRLIRTLGPLVQGRTEIPVQDLPSGFYILRAAGSQGVFGHTNFIKF